MDGQITTERLQPGEWDKLAGADDLFDDPLDGAATRAFLEDPRHHLILGYLDGELSGFVTGVELLHPDKARPEMFLYEISVRERHRRRGVGRALLNELLAVSRERGCREMFVLTETGNGPAIALYGRTGGVRDADAFVMFDWD